MQANSKVERVSVYIDPEDWKCGASAACYYLQK